MPASHLQSNKKLGMLVSAFSSAIRLPTGLLGMKELYYFSPNLVYSAPVLSCGPNSSSSPRGVRPVSVWTEYFPTRAGERKSPGLMVRRQSSWFFSCSCSRLSLILAEWCRELVTINLSSRTFLCWLHCPRLVYLVGVALNVEILANILMDTGEANNALYFNSHIIGNPTELELSS